MLPGLTSAAVATAGGRDCAEEAAGLSISAQRQKGSVSVFMTCCSLTKLRYPPGTTMTTKHLSRPALLALALIAPFAAGALPRVLAQQGRVDPIVYGGRAGGASARSAAGAST